MIRRGYLVLIIGAVLIASSFAVAFSILPDVQSSIESGKFIPSLESMFDSISEKTQILPGDSYSFPYTTKTSQAGLMWGQNNGLSTGGQGFSIDIKHLWR